MTLDQFEKTRWTSGMKAIYHRHNKVYLIDACDFVEHLVGLQQFLINDPDKVTWVRCENITIVEE